MTNNKYMVSIIIEAIDHKIDHRLKKCTDNESINIYNNIRNIIRNESLSYNKGKILNYTMLYFKLSEIVSDIKANSSDAFFNKKYKNALQTYIEGDPNLNLKKDEVLLELIPLRYKLKYNTDKNISVAAALNKVENLINAVVNLDPYNYDNIRYVDDMIDMVRNSDIDSLIKSGMLPLFMSVNIK